MHDWRLFGHIPVAWTNDLTCPFVWFCDKFIIIVTCFQLKLLIIFLYSKELFGLNINMIITNFSLCDGSNILWDYLFRLFMIKIESGRIKVMKFLRLALLRFIVISLFSFFLFLLTLILLIDIFFIYFILKFIKNLFFLFFFFIFLLLQIVFILLRVDRALLLFGALSFGSVGSIKVSRYAWHYAVDTTWDVWYICPSVATTTGSVLSVLRLTGLDILLSDILQIIMCFNLSTINFLHSINFGPLSYFGLRCRPRFWPLLLLSLRDTPPIISLLLSLFLSKLFNEYLLLSFIFNFLF